MAEKKVIHYVVTPSEEASNYQEGPGYKGPLLRKLGFPIGPYSKVGAETLLRQLKKLEPKKKFVILPFIGSYWELKD